MAGAELVPVRAPAGRGLMHRFLEPLCFGNAAVEIKDPLTRAAVDQLLAEAITRSAQLHDLEVGLQRLADQLVPHPVDIRVTEDDLLLVVAAYHVAFQLHHTVAEARVWDRRMDSLNAQVLQLLSGVQTAGNEGQLLARHLMLRHLPVAYRIDTRVEFGAFWAPLTFRGQNASWVQWPLRKHHHIEKNSVWIGSLAQGRCATIYARLLALTPLTKLVHTPTLAAFFDWQGCAPALALPGPCRLATNTILNEGLPRAMPALGRAFIDYCHRALEPVTHRRYIARFLLNLVLTHVTFQHPETLATGPDLQSVEPEPAPKVPVPAAPTGGGKTERSKQRRAELRRGVVEFYAVIAVLHQLRGHLGAAHLYAEEGLQERMETFLSAVPIEKTVSVETFQTVAHGLQYPLL